MNCISKIDPLVSLGSLLYLNLYSNKITEIDNFHTVPKLKALMLGKNLIEKIKNLNNLSELEVLDLHSNKIKIIENLSHLKKLRLLNLANNQITSFSEILGNRNLEEVNLRKNLIVSVPSLNSGFDKLRKLNIGKNMISKIEYLAELKKLKGITELTVEDNPVLILKESQDVLKLLPLKSKEKEKASPLVSKPTIEDTPNGILHKSIEKMQTNITIPNPTETISEEQSINIIAHIKNEWESEFSYIIEHGYNGYNTKRLKESKINSGHAELEGDKKLNIYGNAMEVLDQHEFYNTISTIQFQFYNFDIISQKKNLDKLKKFSALKNLFFANNNIHSFYQLIKFEEFTDLEKLEIKDNEICASSLLKFFLIYRFQNLKYFNNVELSQKDVIQAKKIFEYFDKCISYNEKNVKEDESKKNANGICSSTSNSTIKFNFQVSPQEKVKSNDDKQLKSHSHNIAMKQEFFNYVKDNLSVVIEELINENSNI